MFFPSQLILMNWGSGNMNGRQNYILVIEVECSGLALSITKINIPVTRLEALREKKSEPCFFQVS